MGTITGIVTAVPLDWFILGGLLILLSLDSLRSGIGRAAALAVALPIGYLLYSLVGSAAFVSTMGILASPLSQAITFGVLVILSYFMARRMGLDFIDGGMGEPIQALIASAAAVVILAVIWLQIPALDSVWTFGAQLKAIFAESFRLWWLLGAYVALAFARG